MIEKSFFCKYENQKGEIVTDVVKATSSKEAGRSILRQHPLSRLVEVPIEIGTVDGGVEGGASVKNKRNFLIGVLIATSLLLLGIIIVLAWFVVVSPNARSGNALVASEKEMAIEDENDVTAVVDAEEKVKDSKRPEMFATIAPKPQEVYSQACRHVISIRTGNSIGTGFRLRTNGRVYLYTCRHCIEDFELIVAKDSTDKELRLGDLELCYERDLVRFILPDENDGFELAGAEKFVINTPVVAYGDTGGGGVMTQNKGKILAVGINKIEIDAEVLQGNSGGPVLDDEGKVIAVVSLASVNNTVWAKDTRYAKVRKYAERADGGEWFPVKYVDFLRNYTFIKDTCEMITEMQDFIAKTQNCKFENSIRFTVNELRYKGKTGYADCIRKMYETWNKMAAAERGVNSVLRNDYRTFNQDQLDALHDMLKERDSLLRQAILAIPVDILSFAVSQLRSLNIRYFCGQREELLNEIEKNLAPVVESHSKTCDAAEKSTEDLYQHGCRCAEIRKEQEERRRREEEERDYQRRRDSGRAIRWGAIRRL